MMHLETTMRRGKQDEKKLEQERLQHILLEMLKEDENKYCADCQAKTPRWAAWNLGVFICIRCAGIHRNLGVHISKVRSVNLDSWTAEQVQSMRVMGNEKARKVYEYSLPEHFRRSMSDHQMEQFIRAKYEQKRYIMPNFVYPRVDVNELPKPGQPITKHKDSSASASLTSPTIARVSAPAGATPKSSGNAVVSDLLDFSSPPNSSQQANGGHSLVGDLSSLSITNDHQNVTASKSSDLDDMFGSFTSAPVIDAVSGANAMEQPSPTGSIKQPASTSQAAGDLMSLSATGGSEEKKTTADILSLFGDQAKNPVHPIMPVGGFAAFGLQAAPPKTQQQQQTSTGDPFGAPPAVTPTMGAVPIGMNPLNSAPLGAAPMGLPMGAPMSVPPMMAGTALPGMAMPPVQSFGFPNPFEQTSAAMGMQGLQLGMMASPVAPTGNAPVMQPQSPKAESAYSSRANNAFADLSIGKVMNMNYMAGKTSTPSPVPKPPPSTTPANMNFDDLLGL